MNRAWPGLSPNARRDRPEIPPLTSAQVAVLRLMPLTAAEIVSHRYTGRAWALRREHLIALNPTTNRWELTDRGIGTLRALADIRTQHVFWHRKKWLRK